MIEWVSVQERLPPHDGGVLIASQWPVEARAGGEYDIGIGYYRDGRWLDENGEDDWSCEFGPGNARQKGVVVVTHWAEINEPDHK